MSSTVEILLIAVMVSVSCSLLGNFLVLRQKAMVSDSITHTVLLGMVLVFFITENLSSPLMIIGGALMGVLTLVFTQILEGRKYLSNDAALGLVFPLFFSIAIILIAKYADTIHLDTDSVLLGELAFASFKRCIILGVDIGPISFYRSLLLLLANILFVFLFYKELKLQSFDVIYYNSIQSKGVLLHYGLMIMVSITTVESFEAVGSILVIAFMVVPVNTAYLLANNLKKMILLSGLFSILAAIIGLYFAILMDVSIAGAMAVCSGLIFGVVFLYSKYFH